MPLPNQPWVVQANWTNTDTWSPWEQTNANYLSGCLPTVRLDRAACRGALPTETLTLTADDPNAWVAPGKASSGLWPHVVNGVRVRLLVQSWTVPGTWYPWFFGYVTNYEPDPTDPRPPQVTVTATSPLGILAGTTLAYTAPIAGAVIYDPSGGPSVLQSLFAALGLWGTAYLNFDPVGTTLYGNWGGAAAVNVGQTLATLCALAGCGLACEPRYATTSGDPDYQLHWYQTTPLATPGVHLDASANQLEVLPRIEYNGQQP